MRVYCTGTALIQHALTNAIISVESGELQWHEVPLGPPTDDEPKRLFQAALEHPALGDLFWSVWENPFGTEGGRETDAGDHEVLQDFDFGLRPEPEDDPRTLEAIDWFHANFEDPAERTSHNSREGGYLWNHGGPFDAREEIFGRFPDLPDELLDAAVAEIESDGIEEWAGGRNSDTYEPYEEQRAPLPMPTGFVVASPGYRTFAIATPGSGPPNSGRVQPRR